MKIVFLLIVGVSDISFFGQDRTVVNTTIFQTAEDCLIQRDLFRKSYESIYDIVEVECFKKEIYPKNWNK